MASGYKADISVTSHAYMVMLSNEYNLRDHVLKAWQKGLTTAGKKLAKILQKHKSFRHMLTNSVACRQLKCWRVSVKPKISLKNALNMTVKLLLCFHRHNRVVKHGKKCIVGCNLPCQQWCEGTRCQYSSRSGSLTVHLQMHSLW